MVRVLLLVTTIAIGLYAFNLRRASVRTFIQHETSQETQANAPPDRATELSETAAGLKNVSAVPSAKDVGSAVPQKTSRMIFDERALTDFSMPPDDVDFDIYGEIKGRPKSEYEQYVQRTRENLNSFYANGDFEKRRKLLEMLFSSSRIDEREKMGFVISEMIGHHHDLNVENKDIRPPTAAFNWIKSQYGENSRQMEDALYLLIVKDPNKELVRKATAERGIKELSILKNVSSRIHTSSYDVELDRIISSY